MVLYIPHILTLRHGWGAERQDILNSRGIRYNVIIPLKPFMKSDK